ncbi:lipid droplet-associated protein [Actinokineospora sp.]|uniref:lipid droplet-associated protein n=1 Tax=Actinokineospora sp. TaxID=1872133 RepID=UPI0040382102
MKPLPLPLRIAAGLAVTAVERARDLPMRIAGLPVTVASQALQVSMRVQQHVTELAIKGDGALAALRPVEETPDWATFDEDADTDRYDVSRPAFDRVEDHEIDAEIVAETIGAETDADIDPDDSDLADVDASAADPWEQEEKAIAETPAAVPNYDELSLPQLRARLRAFAVSDLEELLAYERVRQNRPSFVGMLTRRIATVRDQR